MPRSNLAIEQIRNLILRKWDEVVLVTDTGLNKRIKMDQEYEDALEDYEAQVGRIVTGFQKLDQVTSVSQFEKIKNKIMEIVEGDLLNSQADLIEKYLNAIYSAVKDDLD